MRNKAKPLAINGKHNEALLTTGGARICSPTDSH